ncbi:DMT family transporter [Rhizobium sp. Leaf341]|uniref:DMT family transporter n=1 Tax=Rhizobium sp. Leaf341 TaxID=1736344 RepID=UPI000714E208|nr:DMT family transporter [Rhizobium sp. Leaf341]KQR77920.1 hypothetical protein ASG03_16315 [Rhizobium sp. Leaf341]
MKPRDLAAYLFLAFAWGLSFLVLLHVVHAFGWVGAVTLRSFVAGGTLLLFAALRRRVLCFGPRRWPFIIVGATTVAGQLIGLSYATPRIGTAMAAILVAAIPLFSMVIAHLWKLEPMRTQGLLGLVSGTIGIVLLVGFPAVPITPDFLFGCTASLLSAFCAAFGSNYASRHLQGIGSLEVTIGAFLSGALMTLPLLLAVPVPALPSWTDLGALVVLGSGMSALTYVTYFRLVASIGATRAISVEFAVTVVAVLVGALALNEPIAPMQMLGAVIIVAGCALVLGLLPFGRKPNLKPVA